MNIQESAEFQTSKFYCKTDFDMKKIAEEEANYKNYQIPKFYTFPSKDAKERILYQNFVSVNLDVKNMIDEITKFKVNAARKSKVDDNTARMQSIKQLGV